MAFCNSCGATLAEGTRFCSKCGRAIAGPSGPPAAAAPPTTPTSTPAGSGNALKTVLIVIGAVILIGIVGMVSLTLVGLHIVRRTHVRQNGDSVKVETPFGTMESSKDPDQAAKDLGVDIYPGATVRKDGSSVATFGGMRTVTAAFESGDSVDKVCSFYRAKFPGANVSTQDQNHCAIVSSAMPNMVTINVEPSGDGCKFQIVAVTKRSGSST